MYTLYTMPPTNTYTYPPTCGWVFGWMCNHDFKVITIEINIGIPIGIV